MAMFNKRVKIKELLTSDIASNQFEIRNITEPNQAVKEAVGMVRNNEADVLMKGLIGTDTFLKAVLDKEKGLLPPKAALY